jgi:hypothetical protein
MKMSLCAALCATTFVLDADAAWADPGKDESGKGQWRGSDGWQGDPYTPRRHRQAGRIPAGHLPTPGGRVWRPGVPAGHQPPPFRC